MNKSSSFILYIPLSITCTEICTPADDYCHHSEKCTCENLSIYVHNSSYGNELRCARRESSIVPCAINFQHHPLNLFIFKFNDALLFVECVVAGFIAYMSLILMYIRATMRKINMQDE